MFGSHKRQGREAGVAVRNSFASVSMNTSLFEFGRGFVPTREFLTDPYVLGFIIGSLNLMRAFLFKGQKWAQIKTGQYLIEALEQIRGNVPDFDLSKMTEQMLPNRYNPDFELGQKHAELNFGAMFGLIKQSSDEPVVLEARRIAGGLQKAGDWIGEPSGDPDMGFKMAISQLTLKEQLENRFPEKAA